MGYCHVLADAREALAQLSVYPWADVVALGGSLLTLLLGQAIHNVVGGRMQQQRREAQLPEGVEQKSAAQVEMPPQEETVRQDEGGGSNGVEVKAEADMDEEGGREPPCPPHLSEAESMVYAFSGKEPLAMAYLLEIGVRNCVCGWLAWYVHDYARTALLIIHITTTCDGCYHRSSFTLC